MIATPVLAEPCLPRAARVALARHAPFREMSFRRTLPGSGVCGVCSVLGDYGCPTWTAAIIAAKDMVDAAAPRGGGTPQCSRGQWPG